ncbi:tape measure protein [Microbacterium sp. ZXX196]|uniref:phage tail protein n=1 Tax=Microbacterium sp. ZXX196 TaxID=2609291 RepID=UPI0012B9A6E8|nr:tape measure protein [Microbacterium sp. ZXX196]MTE24824.1 tape measure protein [Microbacterium sp. ZXX196]
MAGTEIANAYVALTVKMPGVKNSLTKALSGQEAVVTQSGSTLGSRLMSSMGKTVKVGAVAVGAAITAGLATALAKGFQRLTAIDTAQAKLRGLGHDADSVTLIMENALASVKGTAFGLGDAATVAAQAVAAGIKPGKDLESILSTVSNTAAAAGTGLGEMGSIFSKAMTQANGVQNDVISQVADRGIPIYQALADQMGVTAGEVFKLASEGEINFETFAKAAENASGTVATEMGGTWSGAFDNFMAAMGRVGEGLLSGIFPQMVGGIQDVTTWLAPFEEGAKDVGSAIGSFVADAAPKLIDAIKTIVDVGAGVVTWLRDNMTWLGPLAVAVGSAAAAWAVWTGAISVWTTVTKAAKAAQEAFNLALKSNQIGLIVTAITALVAGLVYFFTQTETGKAIWAGFVQFLQEAWANISQFFTDAWNNVIKPVFTWIGEIATWLWENILQPVFNAISTGIQIVGAAVKLAIDLVVNYFRFWAAVGEWLWKNVLAPAFDAIGAAMTWVWENVIRPVVDFIVAYFRAWGAIVTWLWQTVIQPVFNFIGEIFQWVWRTVIEPVIGWISDKLELLGLGFRILYERFVKPAWDNIARVLRAGWNVIDDHVFAPLRNGIDLVGQAFEKIPEVVKMAWDGIKEAAAKPVNFVLGTVWNDGLRSFWNDVVDELGLDDMKLPKADLVKFATGGVLPGYTPGRDVHEFYSPTGGRLALSGGEAIMRPEFTRMVGGKAGVDRLNMMARRGEAFADGGVWGGVGSFLGDVWDNVANAASVAWDFISDPAGAIKQHIVDGILSPLLGDGGNIFQRGIGALPGMLVTNLASMFEGAAPKANGTKGMGWQAMWDIVQNAIPGVVKTSDYRAGSRTVNGGMSYHASGRAIDLIPASMDTFNRVAALFPNASELIYTPAGSKQLLNGQPFSGWSDAVKRQHYNHVHLAMASGGVVPKLYDQGGWLPHGGVAVNQSGRPEAVLDPEESRALRSGLGGFTNNGTIITQDVDEFFAKAEKSKRRELARVGVFA